MLVEARQKREVLKGLSCRPQIDWVRLAREAGSSDHLRSTQERIVYENRPIIMRGSEGFIPKFRGKPAVFRFANWIEG